MLVVNIADQFVNNSRSMWRFRSMIILIIVEKFLDVGDLKLEMRLER